MKVRQVKEIAAVVTLQEKGQVAFGVPSFYVSDREEQDEVAFLLGRILDAVPHDLGNGTYVLVKH